MAQRKLPGDAVSRLRREDGFTLPELLTAITIALIVSLAAFSLVEFVMKRAGEVDARVDATQRGRAIMDTITRQLRSQVCLDANTAAMATRTGDITDGSTATFYSDFSEGTKAQTDAKPPADLHKLRYDSVTHRITDTTYTTTWNKATTPWTTVVPSVPSATKVIATDVTDNGGAPIFSYYAYNSVTAAPTPSPIVPLGAGGAQLTLPQLMQVARIDITFRVMPTRSVGTNPVGTVTLQDEVYVRAADPNDDAPTPTCA
jgi:prepilin-type N-terminal cleavage/methylation domain-containing protein